VRLTLGKTAEFISAAGDFDREVTVHGYSIDSRTVETGQLFFAVKGERLNGHDYVEQALAQGASAAVVARDQLGRYPVKERLLVVEDTLVALQNLATAVRRLWGKPLIAVTGSAGKTTTKEAIAHVLATRFRVLKSEGNFNNHFGLPLMLLKVEPEHDLAVIEIGMSHAGEIRALAKIAQPEVGVVTNVAAVHLEFFDSLADIARAKYELIESLPANGTAIVNADDEYVSRFGRGFKGKVVSYGTHEMANVRAENMEAKGIEGIEFDVVIGTERQHATLPLVGQHNVLNALAAVSVGVERGMKLVEAVGALATMGSGGETRTGSSSGQHHGDQRLLQFESEGFESHGRCARGDAGKAARCAGGRDAGTGAGRRRDAPGSGAAHRGKQCRCSAGSAGLGADDGGAATHRGIRAEFVASSDEAGEWLAREVRDGDVILLKASRGVKLEKALDVWMARRNGNN
jgi:UDP-N-acetylmuramoyl-tripeptide--D-alanyl-D-alanine ligase